MGGNGLMGEAMGEILLGKRGPGRPNMEILGAIFEK